METFTLQVGNIYTIDDIPESHRELLLGCHHQGQCIEDVREATPSFEVDDLDGLRDHLRNYGAWDDDELSNDDDNLERLLWIMAGNIQENGEAYIGE